MKGLKTLIFCTICSVWTFVVVHPCKAQADDRQFEITFQVSLPIPLESGEQVFIAGSKSQLGNWHPDKIPLTQVNRTLWELKASFPKGEILEFKFTKGSWSNEAVDDNGNPLQNSVLTVSKDTTIATEVLRWKSRADEVKKIVGQITGTVAYHKGLEAPNLDPRDVIVWLPQEYKKFPKKKFPVLYMHDGQNIIDPMTATFNVDWQLDETADSLISQGEIEPLIIVGINNTKDRSDEYSQGEKGDAYMEFLTQTLKPMIDANYRTKKSRKHTKVGGSSMGGLISLMLAWEYTQIFSGAICMSPAFKVRNYDYLDDVLAYKGKKKKIKLYIDNGGIGVEEELQPGIDEMLQALDQKGFTEGEDYLWIKDSTARHSEADWAARSGYALKWLFGK